MIIYNRIEKLAEEKGMSYLFISNKLGMSKNWLTNAIKRNSNIPNDKIQELANILDTTFEYLIGETDKKKSAPVKLTRRTKKVVKIYDSLPAEKQALLDALLEQFALAEGIASDDDD